MYFPTSSILIEFLILAIIDREDSYGYEISQTIKLAANIKESTLYPILKKLEKAGYMTTYSEAYQGRKRKYYSITQEGKNHLQFLRFCRLFIAHLWAMWYESLVAKKIIT